MTLTDNLASFGIAKEQIQQINATLKNHSSSSPETCWQELQAILFNPPIPFPAFQYLYETIYENTDAPNPAWIPSQSSIAKTHIAKALKDLNLPNYKAFHQWSAQHVEDFWDYSIKQLQIKFSKPYTQICDLSKGVENPQWLPEATLNIAENCFKASPDKTAIIYQAEDGPIETINYADLNRLSNRIANSVSELFNPGDAIAIDMLMDINAVAIYLGIIKAGCVVISIADSFAADEIATRLGIANAKGIFTQDTMLRAGKKLPLYEKVVAANAPKAIVIPTNKADIKLRPDDLFWDDFLSARDFFKVIPCVPSQASNILFSSGTTGHPKAIPWTHTTPIKSATDAYFHHDIKPEDILAWPTNLGWMMGPWLIYASLLNNATFALYGGAPTTEGFGQFVQDAKITVLGLVPSLVTVWRDTKTMEQFDWSAIKCFSSTGECSNPDDMLYLMWLANNKPIIEYCGGTEIGGAYITGTLAENAAPATFTTPTLGLDFVLLDEAGKLTDNGEVALIPPSMGLSNILLNRDHYEIYFANMPKPLEGKILRRHGDQIQKLNDQYYRALGRVDDTMNLGGIKTSSAEIERILNTLDEVKETAAIAIPPLQGGPNQLIIYSVLAQVQANNKKALLQQMQQAIKSQLNPLFKIHDIVIIDNLPRTASNKVMRRVLRDQYKNNNI